MQTIINIAKVSNYRIAKFQILIDQNPYFQILIFKKACFVMLVIKRQQYPVTRNWYNIF